MIGPPMRGLPLLHLSCKSSTLLSLMQVCPPPEKPALNSAMAIMSASWTQTTVTLPDALVTNLHILIESPYAVFT
jgi:hypothetical protein